jgi:hypothetical protein
VARDGQLPLTIFRGGKEMTVTIPISPRRPMLIPDLDGAYPSYFVFGPLVFSTATQQFLGGLNNAGSLLSLGGSASPLVTRRRDRPAFSGEALVVVSSPFFPHRLSRGYGNPQSGVVETVNGVTIKNLNHLVEVLRDTKDTYVVFTFAGHSNETLVFPRKDMIDATEEILSDNGVRAQGSPDTLGVWNQKK